MFRNMSISTKIHIPVIIVMIIGLGIVSYNSYTTLNSISDESYKSYAKTMKQFLQQALREKEQIGLTNAINISKNKDVIDSLVTNNRELSINVLQDIASTFKAQSEYKNIKLHIHDKNTHSFIRHWNLEKYGDNLTSFRKSLLEVKASKSSLVTIENGRAGMLLRGISPIWNEKKYIGSIEFIQGFNSVVKKAKKTHQYDVLFLSCVNNENIQKFNKNAPKVGDFFLSQGVENTNKDLMYSLRNVSKETFKNLEFTIIDGYFITPIKLYDYKNEKAGCALVVSNLSEVENFVEEAKSSLLQQIYIIIFLDLVMLLFLLYILQHLIKKPVESLVESIKDIEKALDQEDLREIYAEHKIEAINYDEIGKISQTINALLKQMVKSFVSLKKISKQSSEYANAINQGSIISKSDTRGIITYVNELFCDKTGYSKEELIGQPHNIFRHPNTPKKTFKLLWETIQDGKVYHGLFKNKTKDGNSFYANISIVPIRNEKNEIVEYIAFRDDVTELVNSKKELKQQFFTDPLTSLGNRFKLLEDLNKEQKFFMAIFDIQSFKEINDFYGHEVGDKVIKILSQNLFDYFTEHIYEVYHLGGDEFALTVDAIGITEEKFLSKVRKFLTQSHDTIYTIDDHEITFRLTSGLSYNSESLINEAEIALQHAKSNNIDFVEYTSELNIEEEHKKNLEWSNELKNAIKEGRIQAFYQPIVNIKTAKIEKYETLMRLIKDDGTEVSPFFFLDIAKKTRLYKDLTYIVVSQAFQKFSGTKYEFSINLSAEDIMIHDVSEWLFSLAYEYGVNNQVVIELVESEGIESFDMMDTFIHCAKENGMKIAIDDFGTGYSNFEYLIKLNTDFLKIDGSLIKEIDKDEKLYSVVETIVAFAKKNDIRTIGEFVASEEIHQKLKELDIDYGQGFHLGKPSPHLVV